MSADPLLDLAAALREVPAMHAHLEELHGRLERILDVAAAAGPEPEPLPAGCRPDLRRVLAAIATSEDLDELQATAQRYDLDLRDLSTHEMAWCEGLAPKTVATRRERGEGPEYRCEAGTISYPVALYLEFRLRGRQRRTSQKAVRGRRR